MSITERQRPAGGLSVYDVRNPRHPVLTKTFTLPNDNYWNGVWAKGDALYVASGATGVLVFDISTPANPVLIRNLPGGPPINVHTVFVEGDRLYAMSPSPNAEVLIFDVSAPQSPVLLNRVVVPERYGYPDDAFAYQGRLYVNHTDSGYFILDVANVDNVQVVGRYAFDLQYSHANAVGTFAGRTIAFEGGEQSGAHLRVLDVSSPTQPREIAYFNTYNETDAFRGEGLFDGAIGIRVPGDGHVYVVDTARGLLIFDEP
ncbi:LVIVD repeat-containing protein [Citreicoccus inhibens]|uniref:LVIVD repeat-containing protein n=1 Tax=Citreicoccus inhibens TaxID=2849499 RepID=UPI002E28F150|nr:hypothetical protein [Citreicoccus inhibens]